MRVLQARSDLDAAKAHLLSARTALADRRPDEARRLADAAARDSRSARHAVDDPVVRVVAAIPVLGRSVDAVRGVAQAANAAVTTVVQPLVGVVDSLDPKQLRRPDGSIDLALLARVQPPLDQAVTRSQAISRQVDALPRHLVLWPIGHAAAGFRDQVHQLADAVQKADAGLRVAPVMLGADGPKRWFVMLQQNAESRGTGGLVGGYAVLRTDHGRLTVEAQGANNDLQAHNGPLPPSPDLPKDFVETWRYAGVFNLWQDVNESPDLPSVAKVVRDRWKAQSGQDIDGVIALDSLALADLLQGHAPLQIAGRSVPVTGLVDYLAVGQYADTLDKLQRKDKLAAASHDALLSIVGGGGSSADLLSGASKAVRSGHLHIAAVDPGLDAQLAQVGIDGSLPKGTAPVAYPVLNNGAGNKLDYYLDRSIRYTAGGCGGKRRDSTIAVSLTNRVPDPKGLPAYTMLRLDKGAVVYSPTSRVYLSVYATHGAVLRSARLDDEVVSALPGVTVQQLDVGEEGGLPSWSLSFDLPPGKTRTLVLRLSEPTSSGAARVPEQPLTRGLARDVRVPAC